MTHSNRLAIAAISGARRAFARGDSMPSASDRAQVEYEKGMAWMRVASRNATN